VDGWSAGTYSVNCTVYDTQGRSASSTVTVTVQPTTGGGEVGQGIPIIIIAGGAAVIAIVAVISTVIIKKKKA
jgi:hypothetical protein